MVDNLYRGLIREILAIFCEIDHKIGLLQREAGIHCPPGCGLCYQNEAVETTVLECLPLANVIYSRGEEETILSVIAERVNCGDSRCALFGPEKAVPGNGRCSQYSHRPLVCRLFGFASRRDKFGKLEHCLCRIARKKYPENFSLETVKTIRGLHFPVYQDYFMRVASLHPGLGYRLLPVNTALREALAYLYLKRPTTWTSRKAA